MCGDLLTVQRERNILFNKSHPNDSFVSCKEKAIHPLFHNLHQNKLQVCWVFSYLQKKVENRNEHLLNMGGGSGKQMF